MKQALAILGITGLLIAGVFIAPSTATGGAVSPSTGCTTTEEQVIELRRSLVEFSGDTPRVVQEAQASIAFDASTDFLGSSLNLNFLAAIRAAEIVWRENQINQLLAARATCMLT